MSVVVLNSGDGTIWERRNQTNLSSAAISQGSIQLSGVEIQRVNSVKQRLQSVYHNVINYVCGLEIFDRHNLHLIVFATGILLDPSFFYIPAINSDQICILFDRNIALRICALRTVFDFTSIFFFMFLKMRNDAGIIVSSISLLSRLPLPQVILFLVPIFFRFQISKLCNSAILMAQVQTMMKMRQLPKLSRRCSVPSSSFSRWAANFIFLYLYFGQLVGAIWYYSAIGKSVNCWNKACESGIFDACNGPAICNFNFEFTQNLDLHRFCSTNYDFGVFHDAHQSKIMEMTSSGKKILYCLLWALQNLSTFGQNLEIGSDSEDNFFIFLVIFFAIIFVVGQMQRYAQSDVARFEGIREKKKQETEQWPPFKRLSENLQSRLMNYKQDLWRETKPVNIEDMFYNLDYYLKRQMTHEICFHHLKQLKEFEGWSEESLEQLCDCLKPIFYKEHTGIIGEGDPINKMILVVQGKVWNYSSKYIMGNVNDRGINELVDWFNANPQASDLPISSVTYQAATDVDAFILMAYDLQNISIKKRNNQAILSRVQTIEQALARSDQAPATQHCLRKEFGLIS